MQHWLDNFFTPVRDVLTSKSLNGGKVECLGSSLLDYDETSILKFTWQLPYALYQIFSNNNILNFLRSCLVIFFMYLIFHDWDGDFYKCQLIPGQDCSCSLITKTASLRNCWFDFSKRCLYRFQGRSVTACSWRSLP